MRRTLVAFAAAATLAGSMIATPSETLAQRSVDQDGLINVAVGDVLDVTNVNVAAVAQVVANVCPGVDVENLAILASQVEQTGAAQTVTCTATGAPITLTQNTGQGGQGNNNRPPGRVEQDGLVNVHAADLIDIRDVNIAAAAQAVANVCPGIDVENVAVLASQVDQTGGAQTVTCTATGKAIEITQNLPGRGH